MMELYLTHLLRCLLRSIQNKSSSFKSSSNCYEQIQTTKKYKRKKNSNGIQCIFNLKKSFKKFLKKDEWPVNWLIHEILNQNFKMKIGQKEIKHTGNT